MPSPIPRGPFDQGLFLAHFNKGKELFEARRFEEAERELEEAYLMRPRDVRVLNLLGLVYFRADKLGKAEEVYRKLIAESPDAHTLHHNLGLICFKLGRLDDAEASFRKALELNPGNAKIHFYLGSIYERLARYGDAIYQYRHAGANLMVQRLQGRLGRDGAPAASPATPVASAPAPSATQPPPKPASRPAAQAVPQDPGTAPPSSPSPFAESEKTLRPVSTSLLADTAQPSWNETARFSVMDDTIPPGLRLRPAGAPPERPRLVPGAATGPREVFRGLEKGLMEVDFAGKVFIKHGTIYSYSGNLTFWVKEKRPGARPGLVIVTGTGRLILTDHEREITFMQVSEQPVFVEPLHLLACEEGLSPRLTRAGGEESPVEIYALEGRGMVALSVASKPLPLSVRPGLPVSVPASSVIMWTGSLTPRLVEDPQVYAAVLPSAAAGTRLLRLEGSGRILVEQSTG